MRRLLVALLIAALASPVQASDKFTVHDDQPMVDARRPALGKQEFIAAAENAGFLMARKNLRALSTTDEGLRWVEEEDPQIQEVIKKFRDKEEEFEPLKPEDGFTAPPWRE